MTEIKKLTVKGSLDSENSANTKKDESASIDHDFIETRLEEFKLILMKEIEKKIQSAIKKSNKR